MVRGAWVFKCAVDLFAANPVIDELRADTYDDVVAAAR